MTDDDIPAIVAGLTSGQKDCIRLAHYLDARVYGFIGWEIRGRSANSLSLKGLARGREIRAYTGRSRRSIVLTPLGLRVRQYLKGELS